MAKAENSLAREKLHHRLKALLFEDLNPLHVLL